MNGLICLLGDTFKNNVPQRLPFTWEVLSLCWGGLPSSGLLNFEIWTFFPAVIFDYWLWFSLPSLNFCPSAALRFFFLLDFYLCLLSTVEYYMGRDRGPGGIEEWSWWAPWWAGLVSELRKASSSTALSSSSLQHGGCSSVIWRSESKKYF